MPFGPLAHRTLAVLNTEVSEVVLNQDPFSQTLPSVVSHFALTRGFTRLLNLEPHRAVSLNCCPHSNILETWCFSQCLRQERPEIEEHLHHARHRFCFHAEYREVVKPGMKGSLLTLCCEARRGRKDSYIHLAGPFLQISTPVLGIIGIRLGLDSLLS